MNRGYVNRCLRWLVNEMFPYYENESLPVELSEKIDAFYNSISASIDWYNMTRKDLLRLGFINWDDEEEQRGIWFIPHWLLPLIPEGLTVYDADKKPFEFSRKSCSKEVMYGCLTFGVLEVEDGSDY